MMKSYWIRKTAHGTELELRDIPVPVPGPSQVLVQMRATSVNRGDILATIRRHSADTMRPAGVDGAGVVHAVGEGVAAFAVGDRVMLRARGCFSEYVLADSTLLTTMPARLNWQQAGAVPIAYITAWEALVQFGRLRSGEQVLIAGASSGVGVAALQIAKMLGARVIGVSGSPDKLARLESLGLDAVIQARGSGFAGAVLQATGGQGVSLAVNLVGGGAFPDCVAALAEFGRLAVVGYVDGRMTAELDLESVHGKRLQIYGISNAPLSTAARAQAQRGFESDVCPAIADGRIAPIIDRVFNFADLPAAKAYVEQNSMLGKVVITIP